MDSIDIDDLMGIKELSESLKAVGYPWIERTNLTTWIARRDSYTSDLGEKKAVPNGFPLPVKTLAMGGAYSFTQVLQWVESHYGEPGGETPTRGGRNNDLDIALKRRGKTT